MPKPVSAFYRRFLRLRPTLVSVCLALFHVVLSHPALALNQEPTGSNTQLPALIRSLTASKASIRYLACVALQKYGDQGREATQPAAAMLRDRDARTRAAAAETLVAIGRPAVRALAEALSDDSARPYAAAALWRLGPKATDAQPFLVAALGNPKDQAAICSALGAIGPPPAAAAPALAAAFRSTARDTRRSAQWALEKMGFGAGAVFSPALSDRDPEVRRLAAGSLRRIAPRDPACAEALLRALRDQDEKVRIAAAAALATVAPDSTAAVAAYATALSDSSPVVAMLSAEALARLRSAALPAVPSLIAALDRKDSAAYVSDNVEDDPPAPQVPSLDVPTLSWLKPVEELAPLPEAHALELLPTGDDSVRSHLPHDSIAGAASLALAAIGADGLVAAVQSCRTGHALTEEAAATIVRTQGRSAKPTLTSLLNNVDAPVRMYAALLAGEMPAPYDDIVPILAKTAARDADDDVRAAALCTLAGLGPSAAAAAQPLCACLSSSNADIARLAGDALAAIGPQATPALCQVLRSRGAAERRAAARVLERIGPGAKEALPALVQALAEPSVRAPALAAIAALGDSSRGTIDAVVRALGDSSAEVRIVAADALGRFGVHDNEATAPLLAATRDLSVRPYALASLGALHSTDSDTVSALSAAAHDSSPEVRAAAMEAFAELGRSVQPPIADIVAATKDPADYVREPAVRSLCAQLPSTTAVFATVEALQRDADASIRDAAVSRLGEADAGWTPMLADAVRSAPSAARLAAAHALARLGPAAVGALPAAVATLDDSDQSLVREALDAIGQMGAAAASAAPAVAALAARPDLASGTRYTALVTLREIGPGTESIPLLIRLLRDNDATLADKAADDLVALGRASAPALAQALSPTDQPTASRALKALVALGADAVPSLTAALSTPRAASQAALALIDLGKPEIAGVDPIMGLLVSSDSDVRRRAAAALRKLGAVDAVARALTVADPRVRAGAAEALGRFGADAAPWAAKLLELMADTDANVRTAARSALVALGSSSVRALSDGLAHRDAATRRHAADVLGRLGHAAEAASPAILRGLADRDAEVRRACAQALGRLAKPVRFMPELLAMLRGSDSRAQDGAGLAIAAIGLPTVPSLIDAWDSVRTATGRRDADFRRRVEATLDTVYSNPPESYMVDELAKLLNDFKDELTSSEGLPWPPPPPSTNFVFDGDLRSLLGMDASPVGAVCARLREALTRRGYMEFGFCRVANNHGIALVTRPERIDDSAKPLPDDKGRWDVGRVPVYSDNLLAMWRALWRGGNPPYRVLIFAFAPKGLWFRPGAVDLNTASKWYIRWPQTIPQSTLKYRDTVCYALVYIFDERGFVPHPPVPGRTQLERSGILQALGQGGPR